MLDRATYRETKKKYANTLFFIFRCNWKLSYPEKVCTDSFKLIQGCADDLFESFPFIIRIVNCNVHHHGNKPTRCSDIEGAINVWLQMVGWFLSGQFSRNLAKNNENRPTYAKANHYFTTLWQFKSHSWYHLSNRKLPKNILFIVFLF